MYTVGIEAEEERIELLLSQVKGKDLAELIASGREKMASIPSAGAAISMGAPAAAAGGGAGSAVASAAAEPVKEDKKELVEESDDVIFSSQYTFNMLYKCLHDF